jgi:anti-anti-sigma factor
VNERPTTTTLTYQCPPATVDVEPGAERVVFVVDGEIDLSNAAAVRQIMEQHITRDHDDVVLDLGAVEYLDSASLHLLTEIGQLLRVRRQRLVLVAPNGSPAHTILAISGLTSAFAIAEAR